MLHWQRTEHEVYPKAFMQPAGPADDLRYTELNRQTGGVSLPALPFFAGLWYTVAYPTTGDVNT